MAFLCQYCSKAFKTKQQKQQHELIHEGKKYPCGVCGKPISSQANLWRHMQLHPAQNNDKNTTTLFSVCETDFVCGECKQFFRHDQKVEYQAHLDAHLQAADFGKVVYPQNQ